MYKEFVSFLWKNPGHWFSEINNGVRVMDPISYALYHAFCLTYKYEFGVFDLVSQEIRENVGWGSHPEDYKILRPIYFREKKKYEEFIQAKNVLLKNKAILGMIHLSFDEADDSRIKRAIREIEVLEKEGVHGIIVENYHGSVKDMRDFFEAAKSILEKSKLIVGLNVLPNEYEEAFAFADEVGAKFIQLDYVSGTYLNSKFIYEPHYMSVREKYPHIMVLGGVWPKYYEPISGSDLKNDITEAMKRADAIVVTGEGTGQQTPLEKIKEFRKIAKGFPIFVGAGLTVENVQEQLDIADGGIVGSSLKPAGVTRKEIKSELVRAFMDKVNSIK